MKSSAKFNYNANTIFARRNTNKKSVKRFPYIFHPKSVTDSQSGKLDSDECVEFTIISAGIRCMQI